MGTNAKLTIKQRLENFKAMEKEDKRRWWGEFFIDNSLYIFLIAAIIGIAVYNPNFVSMKSIINIVRSRPRICPLRWASRARSF